MSAPDQIEDPTPPEGDGVPLSPTLADARRYSNLLKVVAHEGRFACLIMLYSGEKPVSAIASGLGLRQPATSQILSSLRATGLVRTRRDGKSVHYSLANADVRRLVSFICRLDLGSSVGRQQADGPIDRT
jgi:DNA-binding transcriptional ArsR family regulator